MLAKFAVEQKNRRALYASTSTLSFVTAPSPHNLPKASQRGYVTCCEAFAVAVTRNQRIVPDLG